LSAAAGSDVQSLALLAVCAALHVSPVPHRGPSAGLRIARKGGQVLPFPSVSVRGQADLDFVVGVGPDGPVMVEGSASEVPEPEIVAALEQAIEYCARFQKAFAELRELAGRAKLPAPAAPAPSELPAEALAALEAALAITVKNQRREALAAAR